MTKLRAKTLIFKRLKEKFDDTPAKTLLHAFGENLVGGSRPLRRYLRGVLSPAK